MRVFLAILFVVGLALLATSKRAQRVRRFPVVAMLVSGGWIWIAIGVLIGPEGLDALSGDTMEHLTPLVTVGLGWIGFMVGFQARFDVLKSLSAPIWRISLVDAVASALVFGALALVVTRWVGIEDAVPVVALIAAASIGWSMETRSLGGADADQRTALRLRAAGGLCAIVAVFVFGLAYTFMHGADADSATPKMGAMRLLYLVLLAVGASVVARQALRGAGRRRADFLAIFLGVVTLVAGAAMYVGVSPLLASMLAGFFITNLAGAELRTFERVILEAEHTVAAMFSVVAGAMLSLTLAPPMLAFAAFIALARLAAKPLLFSLADERARAPARRTAILLTTVRQSPVAIALAVSAALPVDPGGGPAKLLAVVILAGVLSELLPFAAALRPGGAGKASALRASTEPDAGAQARTGGGAL